VNAVGPVDGGGVATELGYPARRLHGRFIDVTDAMTTGRWMVDPKRVIAD